ncbi:MAG: 30S ribosomal protein S15 [Planctomycetota bacterium]
MSITADRRSQLVTEYRTHEKDSGSPSVQVALLTERIRNLTAHLKVRKKDFASQRGLLQMVGRRSKLLRYLQRTDREQYLQLIASLGLRK